MSITVRLALKGKKHRASYEIVVAHTRDRLRGKPIEKIGFWDPYSGFKKPTINNERLTYWIDKGALISSGVSRLLNRNPKKEEKITT